MATKNFIGLDSAAVKKIINSLSDLLANHQVYYTNLRGLHWDIKGDKFFELHELYEEYYNNEASAIDEVAERIAMLGGHPENRFSEYIKKSDIKEIHTISDWEAGIKNIMSSMKTILEKYRNLLTLASGANDFGTVSLARKRISEIETNLWKLTAYMG
ncbi:MAG: DNA starvation/stationary phase protection protein [Tannerella sp.]|jgi:starvation-inducible DNA-binding protein|nr:DNA starvation/stationary phase protection protein [Tannerella sp.]